MRAEPYWIGREVEGRLLGLETLFIDKEWPSFEIRTMHVYVTKPFLKGHVLADYETRIRNLITAGKTVTLEIEPYMVYDIPADLRVACHFLVRLPASWIKDLKSSDTIALDENVGHCFTVTKHQLLEVTPDAYLHDRPVP